MAVRRKSRKVSRRKVSRRKSRKTSRKTKRVSKKRVSKRRTVVRRKKARKNVRGSKIQVFRGSRQKTAGGLTKSSIIRNSRGRYVSKKQHNHGKQSKWIKAVVKARKNLKIKGFMACKKGTRFYKEAKRIYEN